MAHFVSISFESGWQSGGAQLAWLEADLAAVDKRRTPWTVLYVHRPIYCSNTYSCNLTAPFAAIYEPLFYDSASGGVRVDLVLTSHVHCFERMHQVTGGVTVDNGYAGMRTPLYILQGSAGCDEGSTPWTPVQPSWSAVRLCESVAFGFSTVEVLNSTHLRTTFVNAKNGSVLDEVTISKAPSAPAPTSVLLSALTPAQGPAERLLRPWLADAPLNQFPMLQAHDAGTVYLSIADALAEIANRFARTQSGGNVTALLDCGARAFDWRPSVNASGFLGFAHGPLFVPHAMEAAAGEVVAWANAHAAEAEDALVLILAADCDGECRAAATAAFARAGLPVADCGAAADFTLSAAMAAARLPGGGHAVVLYECAMAPVNTYDDRLSCTGFFNVSEGEAFEAEIAECTSAPSLQELLACVQALVGIADVPDHFACYTDGSGKNETVPFERLLAWLEETSASPLPSGPGERGLLSSIQGCWAQNVQSTVLSFLHGASLLLDDTRAEFNSRALLEWVSAGGPLKHVSLVGMNNVCGGAGPQLLAALRGRLARS